MRGYHISASAVWILQHTIHQLHPDPLHAWHVCVAAEGASTFLHKACDEISL